MTNDKIKTLMGLCKCGVHITVNAHRDYYETVEKHFEEPTPEMIATDTVINVQAYPETPIGSYDVYSHDLDDALDRVIAAITKERQENSND